MRSFSYVLGGYIITILAYGERRQYSAAVSLSLSLDDIKKSRCVKILSSTLFIDAFLSLSLSRAKAAVLGGKFLRVIRNGLAVVAGEFVVHLFEAP